MVLLFFFFKQMTAYEISNRDWSSDVCSSDLAGGAVFWGNGFGRYLGLLFTAYALIFNAVTS